MIGDEALTRSKESDPYMSTKKGLKGSTYDAISTCDARTPRRE